MKNPTLCTVDDTVHELIWEAFKYFDLPQGQYEITCGGDIMKKTDFWGTRYYQKGANRVLISISNGGETFVRVDQTKEKPAFLPVLVEKSQARAEMTNFPYQIKDHRYIGEKIAE